MLNKKKVLTYIFKTLILPVVAVILYFVGRLLESNTYLVEKLYSTSINKWVVQIFSQITGIVPFSIGEFIVILHFVSVPVLLGILIYKCIKGKPFNYIRKLISYVSMIYIVFMLLWGFNYSRTPIGETLDLDVRPSTTQELYDLGKALVNKANALRPLVSEDAEGVMTIEGGYKSVFKRADLGYNAVSDDYPVLAGKYGRPKYILLSRPMLYTGIVGVYFPFTAEANVNVASQNLFLPFDTLHEMAHQRGFASEDEANYIAYLTSSNHPDIDFRYSGTLYALTSVVGALMMHDQGKASELQGMYCEAINRDLDIHSVFWSDYDGEVSDVADTVNDSYLKGNGQKDGVNSYGRMVDLLLAHYRKHGNI